MLRIPHLTFIFFISNSTQILIRSQTQNILLHCQTELEAFNVIREKPGDFHTARGASITISSAPWLTIFFKNLQCIS